MKVPARFAAFANGIAIHADDYDDTQLAVAKDRVYGLLTHPTAPALPPVLALGERDNRSGLDVLTAYQIARRSRDQDLAKRSTRATTTTASIRPRRWARSPPPPAPRA